MFPNENHAGTGGSEARAEAYDVVVVGGGMAGLTAGALLARAGQEVLVVDANDRPGGYTRALRQGAYTFDCADHLLMECAPGGPFGPGVIDAVLRHLEVQDRCEFVRVDAPFYATRWPDLTLAVPGGREPFVEAHLHHFPNEERGLRHLMDLGARLIRELKALPIEPGLIEWLRFPHDFPTLLRYRNATVRQVVDRELRDPRLKEVYLTLEDWLSYPRPGSFALWGAMLASYVEDGPYYCRGSFQRLADAVADGLTLAGGELLCSTRVAGIEAHDRQVTGVVLESGQRIRARTVIAAIDARDTFERLLGPEHLPERFLHRLHALDLSGSVVMLYLGTAIDPRALGAVHETFISTEWDAARRETDAHAGHVSRLWIVIPTLTDPELAPPGEHVVILTTPAPEGPDPLATAARYQVAEQMLALAETVLPGLRANLTYVADASPGVSTPYPLHLRGPIYGWGTSPRQVGYGRLPQRTPVAGLYLAGHWTRPVHGVSNVVQSGVQAARLVLDVAPHGSVLPLRLPTAVPQV